MSMIRLKHGKTQDRADLRLTFKPKGSVTALNLNMNCIRSIN